MSTITTRIALRNDISENWAAKNPVLAKGELGIEYDTATPPNLVGIKVGNGTTAWAELGYFSTKSGGDSGSTIGNIYQVSDLSEITATLSKGDIAIVKKDVYANTDKYEYTAYIHTGTAWAAMDGNYSAENVYFKEDLLTTSAVGNITLTNGSATIQAAGKNLKEVFNTIFTKELNPTVTKPSITLSAPKNTSYEVGTNVIPTYTISFNPGKYSYGPETGVTVSSYGVSFNGKTLNASSGSFESIQVTDGMSLVMSAEVQYTDGNIPLTNLGNEYSAGKITSGTLTKTSSALTGYRKTFYGTLTTKPETMSSSDIRSLAGSTQSSVTSVSVNIPVGAYRIIIAVPEGKTISAILDVNGLNANIINSFSTTTVAVNGANDYTAKNYTAYYLDRAVANEKENTYKVTIG